MKRSPTAPFWIAAVLAGTSLSLCLAAERDAQVDFGPLTFPSSGGECVEVRINRNLIAMAARLAEHQEPEAAELLRGLQSVHVSVVSLDDSNREATLGRIASVRAQLDTGGWDRVATVKQGQEDVQVFLKTRGEEAIEGVVVTVIERGQEAILVNVVGDLRPEKIAVLGERFNIEPLRKLGRKLEKP
jgi:beta-lactamase superfamily II metal-dependent hydrolase